MKNIDIDEWLLNNNINPQTVIKNEKDEDVFVYDLLKNHLKDQLNAQVVNCLCGLKVIDSHIKYSTINESSHQSTYECICGTIYTWAGECANESKEGLKRYIQEHQKTDKLSIS